MTFEYISIIEYLYINAIIHKCICIFISKYYNVFTF